jgi:hypothetical protein
MAVSGCRLVEWADVRFNVKTELVVRQSGVHDEPTRWQASHMIMRTALSLALVCELLIGGVLRAQVKPALPGPQTGAAVVATPQRPRIGSITPKVDADEPDVARVFAIGTAAVFNGNTAAARQAALQAAYSEAVAMGAGTTIGRLTLIRNVRAVTDVVSSRSQGFVKSYEVIAEQTLQGNPQQYEIRIRAEVIKRAQSPAEEIDGLKLFLEVIGSPKLLILLPGSTPEQGSAQPEADGTVRATEAALAAAFAKYGYPVVTSDDLVAGHLASAEQLSRARQGVTADALAVARAAGADLLLIGVLRTATQRVAPQGVEFVSATTEASAKAMVVSNGYLIDAFHKTVTRAQVSALGAVSSSVDAIAADFASTLAWKIPSLLTARPRVTHLVVDNVSFRLAERLKAGLETMQGIDAVRFAAVPTATRRTADLELLSGYVMVPQDELVNHCIESVGPMRIRSADKYTVSLTLM